MVTDLSRSMELVYQRPGSVGGVPVYRFVAPTTLFANGTDYAPNEGFCPCRQSGLLNVSSCRQSEHPVPTPTKETLSWEKIKVPGVGFSNLE